MIYASMFSHLLRGWKKVLFWNLIMYMLQRNKKNILYCQTEAIFMIFNESFVNYSRQNAAKYI